MSDDSEELSYLRDQLQLERDELARRSHAAHLWGVVRQLLIEAGCRIEDGCHVPTTVGEWLRRKTASQPKFCRDLVKAGWKFEWISDVRFVAAEHPLGGKQSIVEVCRTGRTGFDQDALGKAIADLMNGHSK